MEFTIPEELKMLQATVRRFVEEEFIPLEKLLPPFSNQLPDGHKERLRAKLQQIGIWALNAPVEYGGGGISTLGMCLVNEELNHSTIGSVGVAIYGGDPPVIVYEGNDAQKEKYLIPIIRGEMEACFAQTEPNAGSDPASMETSAVKDGDNWILNGSKIFISHAEQSDYALVFAVTDKQKRNRGGITCFIVETKTPGFKVTRLIDTMGGFRPAEIVLQDCVVPDENRLGPVGRGFQLAQSWLAAGRLIQHPPACVGASDRSLKMAINYSKQRVTFGQPLSERQAVQWMLADSAVEIHAARMMTYQGAWKADQGEDIRVEAAICKLYATEMACRVIDRAIQIHGGVGYSRELPLERFYRDFRRSRITEGASEVQRFIIARDLLRD